MKAIIFAAGKGTRMGDISKTIPKPLNMVLGKSLLEHKIDILPEEIDEILIVVGHLKEKIIEHISHKYPNKKIHFIVQDQLKGTANCLWLCRDYLIKDEKFIVMMGDDIYSQKDIKDIIKYDIAILISEVKNIKGKSKVVFDENNEIIDIIEKNENDESGYINTGLYVLTTKIFDYQMVKLKNDEYGLPQTILSMKNNIMKNDIKVKIMKADFYIQITNQEDLKNAENILKNI